MDRVCVSVHCHFVYLCVLWVIRSWLTSSTAGVGQDSLFLSRPFCPVVCACMRAWNGMSCLYVPHSSSRSCLSPDQGLAKNYAVPTLSLIPSWGKSKGSVKHLVFVWCWKLFSCCACCNACFWAPLIVPNVPQTFLPLSPLSSLRVFWKSLLPESDLRRWAC